ncbi:MAG: hypothetical protein HYZ57_01040 [Acidobacteria bacterium]|nr:hypothetical protein [Acidobacteriota bacterium]
MRVLAGLVLFAAAALPQAVVESALTTGASTNAAAGAKSAGKSISGVFGKLSETAAKAGAGQTAVTRQPAATAKTAAASSTARAAAGEPGKADQPKPLPDTTGIKTGMDREELLKIMGRPAMRISMPEGGALIERMTWAGADGELRVTLRDGKITQVNGPTTDTAQAK